MPPIDRLSTDWNKRFGRGSSVDHLDLMRLFYHTYPLAQSSGTASWKLLSTNWGTSVRRGATGINLKLVVADRGLDLATVSDEVGG